MKIVYVCFAIYSMFDIDGFKHSIETEVYKTKQACEEAAKIKEDFMKDKIDNHPYEMREQYTVRCRKQEIK